MGSVLFRLLVAIALRWGLDPNDLKLMTALFVFAALVLTSFSACATRRPRKAFAEPSRTRTMVVFSADERPGLATGWGELRESWV